MEEQERKGFDRRTFLKRTAIAGAVAWSVPLIETIGASPAFAASVVDWSACVGGCNAAGPSCDPQPDPKGENTACQTVCTALCGGPGRTCCNNGVTDSSKWCSTSGSTSYACYFGDLSGCSVTPLASCCGGTNNAVCASGAGTLSSTCQCT